MAQRQPHVLIVGGAYGGLSTLNTLISLSAGKPHSFGPKGPGPSAGPPNVPRALRVKPRYTLLDERDGFYHTVGAPLGQISPSFAREFWIKYNDIENDEFAAENVQFLRGSANSLDTGAKVLHYSTSDSQDGSIPYDYLVVATGMRRGSPVVPQATNLTSHLVDVEHFSSQLDKASTIVFVGGGAVGIEMAAYAKFQYPRSEVILVHSRDTVLSAEPLPDAYKAKALELLGIAGVTVKLGCRVTGENVINTGEKSTTTDLSLSNGETLRCDKVIYTATQKGANTGFIPQQALDDKGCIQVRETLQFPTTLANADSHYAVGDVASWTGIKRSGGAQSMGKYAATNIILSLLAAEDDSAVDLAKCEPFKPTMSLAVGEQAIGMRGGTMRWGKDVKERAFGYGLGINGTLSKLHIKRKSVISQLEDGERVNGVGKEGAAISANM